jgi:hypothetical protein
MFVFLFIILQIFSSTPVEAGKKSEKREGKKSRKS